MPKHLIHSLSLSLSSAPTTTTEDEKKKEEEEEEEQHIGFSDES